MHVRLRAVRQNIAQLQGICQGAIINETGPNQKGKSVEFLPVRELERPPVELFVEETWLSGP